VVFFALRVAGFATTGASRPPETRHVTTFDYCSPAELFIGKRRYAAAADGSRIILGIRARVRQRVLIVAEGNAVERSKSELAAIERRLRKIVDAIADGAPARTLKDELFTLVARQDELRAFLARPEPDRTLVHPGLAEIYRRKVAALHEALEDEATRDEAMEPNPIAH
jgi:hypothetical protein